MDGLTFFKVMRVLSDDFTSATINSFGLKDGSVIFSIYKNGKISLFEYRASPQPPALIRTTISVLNAPGALSNIVGAKIVGVGSFGYDRIGFLDIVKRKPSGKLQEHRLILELTGNYANFFLLNDLGIILYSLSSRTIDPDRDIGVGSKYYPPRANKLFSLDRFENAKSFNDLIGFYPVTAKHADKYLDNSSDSDNDNSEAFTKIRELLISDTNFYIDDNNKVIPFRIDNPKDIVTFDDLDKYYVIKGVDDQLKYRTELLNIYKKPLAKYLKVKAKLIVELNDALNYSLLSDEATLLTNNLYKVDGAGEYIFDDYSDGSHREVKYIVKYGELLNERVDKLFKRASRLKRSVTIIENRVSEYDQLIAAAQEQLYFIEELEDSDEIKRLLLANRNDSDNISKRKKEKHEEKDFHEYQSDEYTIMVGRNASSNHKLIMSYAISSDYWFHTRLIPSAHLILRVARPEVLTTELINYVASIVASFSKNRDELKVDVDYTRRKYLSKPKGTPIGFVTYKNFQTVTTQPMSRDQINELFNL